MTKPKTKKDKTPKQIYVATSYGVLFVYKSIQEAFDDGRNVIDVYNFEKKQKLVVQVEDI